MKDIPPTNKINKQNFNPNPMKRILISAMMLAALTLTAQNDCGKCGDAKPNTYKISVQSPIQDFENGAVFFEYKDTVLRITPQSKKKEWVNFPILDGRAVIENLTKAAVMVVNVTDAYGTQKSYTGYKVQIEVQDGDRINIVLGDEIKSK